MPDPGWHDLDAALDAASSRGGPVRFWLRDDDAVEVTSALQRLAACCGRAGLPVLLAVIPAGATPTLAGWLAERPAVTPCQHGWAHTNHASSGARACELGGDRPDAAVLDDLRRGRERLRFLLGPREPAEFLVPPWNRIRDSLLPDLAALGFAALSTFTGAHAETPLPRLDCDLDIIDWRNGRVGRSEADLCRRLVRLVGEATATDRAIGLLTHHLAHDEAAWAFLDRFCGRLAGDARVVFTSARAELASRAREGERLAS